MTSGSPKLFAKGHESGMTLKVYFCENCGSTIYKEGTADAFQGVILVQGGSLNDPTVLNEAKVDAELYVPERLPWLHDIVGAGQMKEFS